MPPKKRNAKAKADTEADSPASDARSGSASPPPAKKAKAGPKAKEPKGPVTPLDAAVPHNKAFPEELSFETVVEGGVRVAMWNVAGVKASLKKVGIARARARARGGRIRCGGEGRANMGWV